MLIEMKQAAEADPQMAEITQMIAGNRGNEIRRIQAGLYLTGHWNFEMYLGPGWAWYPKFEDWEMAAYGVCDSPRQFLDTPIGKHIQSSKKSYVVSFVHLRKKDESPEGGWRWHKWGPYIGNQEPQCEYLFDEPVIEEVYTYHIYEKE